MTKKFLEIVKRQTVLAAKAAGGDATPEELTELTKLNVAIKAATEPTDAKIDTTLKIMTLADFRVWHEKAVKAIEDGDDSLLGVVKRNLAAVKDQGKTLADDIVAVEMPIEKSDADVVADLQQRIADLEAKAEADPKPSEDGEEDEDGDGEGDAEKGDKPIAQALAMEAIDTLLAKYTKLKALVDAGTFSKTDLDDIFDGDWSLKDIIRDSAAIMAKTDEMKAAVEALMPELEKLDKAEDGEGDGDGEAGDSAEGDGSDAEGKDKGGDGEGDDKGDADAEGEGKDGAEKSGPTAWASGLDIAPKRTAEEQHQDLQKKKENFGY